jgi:DNA-directed RNA polymerase specialized sigma24 family protein
MDLRRVLFLLTGTQDAIVDFIPPGPDLKDSRNSFFSAWMLSWARKVAIQKALAPVREEIAQSGFRTSLCRVEASGAGNFNAALDNCITHHNFETALLSVDVFPRCVLVLSVVEKLSIHDTAILLDAGNDLVRKALLIGRQELTRNLAGAEF